MVHYQINAPQISQVKIWSKIKATHLFSLKKGFM